MRAFAIGSVAGVGFVLVALLASQGTVLLCDGVARNNAVPVPVYMTAGKTLPLKAYRVASDALANANNEDGIAAVFRAEAALRAGAPAQSVMPILKTALTHAPSSARGWLLLSKVELELHSADAANSLTMSLMLAPYDFWTIGERARLSAILWNKLQVDAQVQALSQTRLLWSEPQLHNQLYQLAYAPGGAALISLSFKGQDATIRDINRWLARAPAEMARS